MRLRFPIVAIALISALAVHGASATPLGTAFGFEGRLLRNNQPVNGTTDIRYTMWDDALAGAQKGAPVTQLAVPLTDGLVSTTLDFGAQYDGNRRWVQVEVKGSSDVSFVTLTPRYEILPVPYALWSASGASSLTLPFLGIMGLPSTLFEVRNTTNAQLAAGIRAETVAGIAVEGVTNQGSRDAILGTRLGDGNDAAGVHGDGQQFSMGVLGTAQSAPGVKGSSAGDHGVFGITTHFGSSGVYGRSELVDPNGAGVTGYATTLANGVHGYSGGGHGVLGEAIITNKAGVMGTTNNAGGYGGWFENTGGGVSIYAPGEVQVGVLTILGGADLAERFETADPAEPGTVMAIDPASPGRLRVCDKAYSPEVAGVVSGAKALSAGVVLGRDADVKDGQPVALSGRVWVRCDASRSPIRPGDLLTTAERPGYAMRATDSKRSQGAILGKAMSSLEAGTGFVLVLVSLQ